MQKQQEKNHEISLNFDEENQQDTENEELKTVRKFHPRNVENIKLKNS